MTRMDSTRTLQSDAKGFYERSEKESRFQTLRGSMQSSVIEERGMNADDKYNMYLLNSFYSLSSLFFLEASHRDRSEKEALKRMSEG